MMKFKSRKFCRGSFKFIIGGGKMSNGGGSNVKDVNNNVSVSEVKWELRPGGMLVQKREVGEEDGGSLIQLRVSTVSQWHLISIDSTSTFGELKMVLSLVTSLEPREQRLLYKGKEREDNEYLHMVGVQDKDKVLLLQDPAIKEMKNGLTTAPTTYRTISV